MGRYLGPKEKISRRLGANLGLKPERSFGPKSAFLRRPYPPGLHGKKRRRAPSDYGLQLAEKQKVRFSYGISEKQLRKYFNEAKKSEEATGNRLFEILERRLDNVIYRLGLAPSRLAARQMVNHGHFKVNNRRVKIPSYQVKKGDRIVIRPGSKDSGLFKNIKQVLKNHERPAWLKLNQGELEAEIIGLPVPDEAAMPFDMQLLIEFYSR